MQAYTKNTCVLHQHSDHSPGSPIVSWFGKSCKWPIPTETPAQRGIGTRVNMAARVHASRIFLHVLKGLSQPARSPRGPTLGCNPACTAKAPKTRTPATLTRAHNRQTASTYPFQFHYWRPKALYSATTTLHAQYHGQRCTQTMKSARRLCQLSSPRNPQGLQCSSNARR